MATSKFPIARTGVFQKPQLQQATSPIDKLTQNLTTRCHDTPLCLTYPSLHDVVDSKGAKVVDLWVEGSWDFIFGTHFNDWELASVQQFLSVVGQRSLNLEPEIKFFGSYLQMVYPLIVQFQFFGRWKSSFSPCKMLRNSLLPIKVSFFAWKVKWGEMLAQCQLKKRGFSLASFALFAVKRVYRPLVPQLP